MSPLPDTLTIEQANEFHVTLRWADEDKGRYVLITRYTNHHGFVKDGKWMVCIALSPMNPWYLSTDGVWRYKYGSGFDTAEDAYACLKRSGSITASLEINDAEQKKAMEDGP